MEIIGRTGLRLLVILLFAILLTRALKAMTARLVQLAKSQSRAGQMREQQTRTMAGLLYSIGAAIIGLIAVLMAFEVLGFDIAPAMATAAPARASFTRR
jgi:small-conductance mechanosensitive channel